MLEKSLQDKIDVYLKPKYISVVENTCELEEREDTGRTRLKVILPSDKSVLCIKDHDHKPRCNFLNTTKENGLGMSVDHILMTPNPDGTWTVHLIEMKSGLGRTEWKEISKKARASMINMKAATAVLDVTVDAFKVYTTYERLSHYVADPTSIVERKHKLGTDWKEDEWDKHQIPIYIPKGKKDFLWHCGIKMNKQIIDGKDTLCGELILV